MDAELKKAKLEGRTALARMENSSPRPWSPIFSQVSAKLTNVPRAERGHFEIHVATHRTTLNPREVMVLRVLLPKPFDQYPDGVGLTVFFDQTSSYTPVNMTLLPDTEENR